MTVRSLVSILLVVPTLALAGGHLAGCGSSDSGAATPGPAGTGGAAGASGAAGMSGAAGTGGDAGTGGMAGAAGGGDTGGMAGAGGDTGTGGTGGMAVGGAGGAAGTMGTGGFMTAKHASFPTIPKFGGPVLASPQIITVTYTGYKYTKQVQDLGDWMVSSDWLTSWGTEYGVGKGNHLQKVELPDTAPTKITDDEFQAFLTAKLMDGTLPSAPGNPNDYLYMFYFPQGTKYTQAGGGISCVAFGGFHNGLFIGSTRVAYAVVNDCGGGMPEIGVTASHELAEAATDPMFNNNPAYQFGGGGTLNPWQLWGSEVGDICEGTSMKDPTSGFFAQRIWSNANGKMNLDPCVPTFQPDGSVFTVSPAPSNAQQVNPGQVVTFKLTGWSTKERTDWSLGTSLWTAGFQPKITLSSKTINNGQTVDLTVNVPNSAQSGSLVVLTVDSKSGTEIHSWPVVMFVPLSLLGRTRRVRVFSPFAVPMLAVLAMLGTACDGDGSSAGGGGGSAGSSSGGSGSGSGGSSGGGSSGGGSGGGSSGGGGGSSGSGGSNGGGAGYIPTAHEAFPLLPDLGGPVLAAPQIVTVTFPGYPYRTDVEGLGDWIASGDWLSSWGPDYGVGKATHLAKVAVSDVAPAQIGEAELEAWLGAKLADGTLPKPGVDANDDVFVVYLPATTKLTRLGGSTSCASFLGYHSAFLVGTTRVTYAVVATCGKQPGIPEVGVVTATASHEIAEAVTDPLPTSPGYTFPESASSSPWRLWGGENGDLCGGTHYQDASGVWTQRIWSNAHLAGDPCVPAAEGDTAMFGVSPSPSTVQMASPGQTITFQLTGWSLAPRADWLVTYTLWREDFVPTIALSPKMMNDGVTGTLTLIVPNTAQPGGVFLMTLDARSGPALHAWPVAVRVQ